MKSLTAVSGPPHFTKVDNLATILSLNYKDPVRIDEVISMLPLLPQFKEEAMSKRLNDKRFMGGSGK